MGQKYPSPQYAFFSAEFLDAVAIFFDFSTTPPLVRGSFAMYIVTAPLLKEVHDDCCHHQAPVRLGLPGR